MTTYFISDIHLHANADRNSSILLDFLQTTAFSADAIYILGDLFSAWFGDDVHMNDPYVLDLIHALKNLVVNNIPVYIMHGNRDFLISDEFCAASGCKLLPDPCVINLYDHKVMLSHGDLFCRKDFAYQRFRKVVQNPSIKKLFLSLPKALRLKIGNMVRHSSARTSSKRYQQQPEIFDVDPASVHAWINAHGVEYFIHGHTHKPDIHMHDKAKRIVLGDWNETSIKILAFNAQANYSLLDLA